MNSMSKELQRLVEWLREDGRPEALDSARAIVTMSRYYNWSGRKTKAWTNKEIGFLKKNCMTMTRKQLAHGLGRTQDSVNNQMSLRKIGRKYQETT